MKNSPQRLTVVPSPAGEVVDRPPLIPPGEYRLMFGGWQTWLMWGKQPKLIAWFTVTDFGDFHGTRLARYYNVKKIVGKPAMKGNFKVTWNSDLVREYARLFPSLNRLDRIYLDRLAPLLIVGTVKTVTKTAAQEKLASSLEYSVIGKLSHAEAGHKP